MYQLKKNHVENGTKKYFPVNIINKVLEEFGCVSHRHVAVCGGVLGENPRSLYYKNLLNTILHILAQDILGAPGLRVSRTWLRKCQKCKKILYIYIL